MKLICSNLLLILFIFLFRKIKSQENQYSQNKLKEIEDNISKINSLYQNLTEKMTEIKYNFILKLRYKFLSQKKEEVEQKLNDIKSSGSPNQNSLNELNEYVYSYKRKCKKVIKLYDSFEILKITIINILKLFILAFIIIIIVVIIIAAFIYYYIYRKRRNYDALHEEMSHSDFQTFNDIELGKIKKKKNKKKKLKKKKKIQDSKEDADSKEKVENKNENIEVLDDK